MPAPQIMDFLVELIVVSLPQITEFIWEVIVAYLKMSGFIPKMNFGHFWPFSPLTFHNVKNHGG